MDERDQGSDIELHETAPGSEAPPIAFAPRRRRHRGMCIAGFSIAGALLLTAGAAGGAWGALRIEHAGESSPAAIAGPSSGGGAASPGEGWGTSGQVPGGFGRGFGRFQGGESGNGTSGGLGSGSGTSTQTSATAATAAQEVGVVTVDTVLGYERGKAAGTGIVLTVDGEILTNNHVVAGSTSIQVTVESTGRTYIATVVGTDPTDDVAVLQLKGASGLRTATLASTAATTGQAVTAVGNAGGTGELTAASGTVTALGRTITTQAEGAAASETLHGLIEHDADVVAGDSGGPLVNSAGAVVGIDTAASSGTREPDSYAIPIATAVSIASRIESGRAGSGITIGYPAFLGVSIDTRSSSDGALVARALDGTPAAAAGITAGDTVTAVDGHAVLSGADLTTVLHGYRPGDRVTVSWTDDRGTLQRAAVTLVEGPAN
ncbi:S1C family serine protease [Amnibacterium endophyticum]|uniref:S1C family serine protease n=1 Tax=Amnibacterium endophyticum TaxID=2109337 RepID=A0ABW4LIF2_9MICO